MKKKDKKHPNRPSCKLLRIEQSSRWQNFKRHVPFLKNTNMRRRITYLFDSLQDPFAADILYYKPRRTGSNTLFCNLNKQLEDFHLQNINIDDARKLFFRHVDEVMFRNGKIRQLQWLISDYKLVVGDYGLEVGGCKEQVSKIIINKGVKE